MKRSFFVLDSDGFRHLVYVRPARQSDYERALKENWVTDWNTDYLQNPALEKYAFLTCESEELIALGAYLDDQAGICVFISYAESHSQSNPVKVVKKEKRLYYGIGKVVIAYGVQLSLDRGYDGTVYFKAKTTELYQHFKRDFGAVDLPSGPYMLIIFDSVARALLDEFNMEEGLS